MAEAVRDVVSRILDAPADRGVEIDRHSTGPHLGPGLLLDGSDEPVQLTLPVGGATTDHGAGHVCVIAVDTGPEVHLHEIAGLEPPARRRMMRLGTAGPEGDDALERRLRLP